MKKLKTLMAVTLAVVLACSTAYAAPGGEGDNSNCNGQGNPNSLCNGSSDPTQANTQTVTVNGGNSTSNATGGNSTSNATGGTGIGIGGTAVANGGNAVASGGTGGNATGGAVSGSGNSTNTNSATGGHVNNSGNSSNTNTNTNTVTATNSGNNSSNAATNTVSTTATNSGNNSSNSATNSGNNTNVSYVNNVPRAPVSTAYSPTPVVTANCKAVISGGIQVVGFGASAGTPITDETCQRIEKVRAVITYLQDIPTAEEIMCSDLEYRAARARIGRACIAVESANVASPKVGTIDAYGRIMQ